MNININHQVKNLVVFLFLFYSPNIFAQPAGYGFVKKISIQSSQISGSSTFTDFPILVSFTDIDLKSIANGGNVEHANGYDIIFIGEDCSTPLDHQIEKYNPISGEYVTFG